MTPRVQGLGFVDFGVRISACKYVTQQKGLESSALAEAGYCLPDYEGRVG